jgi:hypothetical protein
MMGLEWLPIVLSDVTVHGESGLAAQIAVEEPGVVILDDDGALAG